MVLNQRIFQCPRSFLSQLIHHRKKKKTFPSATLSLYFLALFLLHKGSGFKNIFKLSKYLLAYSHLYSDSHFCFQKIILFS